MGPWDDVSTYESIEQQLWSHQSLNAEKASSFGALVYVCTVFAALADGSLDSECSQIVIVGIVVASLNAWKISL